MAFRKYVYPLLESPKYSTVWEIFHSFLDAIVGGRLPRVYTKPNTHIYIYVRLTSPPYTNKWERRHKCKHSRLAHVWTSKWYSSTGIDFKSIGATTYDTHLVWEWEHKSSVARRSDWSILGTSKSCHYGNQIYGLRLQSYIIKWYQNWNQNNNFWIHITPKVYTIEMEIFFERRENRCIIFCKKALSYLWNQKPFKPLVHTYIYIYTLTWTDF